MHYIYQLMKRHRPLYTKKSEAVTLLTRCKSTLEREGILLVDYLLLPSSLELLLAYQYAGSSLLCIPSGALLSTFAHLGRVGSNWPYSGFHELFHKSHCFAELGKSGFSSPLPLHTIIDAKRKQSTTSIGADEIA